MATDSIQQIIAPHLGRTGGLLRALHAVMKEYGYINPDHFSEIADVFNVSQAEVRGVVSFYHDFRTTPPTPNRIRICQAEACQALGSRALTRQIEERLRTTLGGESEDGLVSLDPVYCLGLCSIGPAIQVNEKLIARATLESIAMGS